MFANHKHFMVYTVCAYNPCKHVMYTINVMITIYNVIGNYNFMYLRVCVTQTGHRSVDASIQNVRSQMDKVNTLHHCHYYYCCC